jgi:ABC-2 type transport system permease protein
VIPLLAGELRRVKARRLVKVIIAFAATGIVIAGIVTFLRTHPLPEATYQSRVQAAQAQIAQGGIPICPTGNSIEGKPDQSGQFHPTCLPQGAVRVHDPRLHLTQLKGVFQGVTAPLLILSCLIGASVIGADWQSRTITTILTWEPRRPRVLSAKVLSSVLISVALTLAALIALGLALLPSALLHGTTAGADGAWWRSAAGVVLRAMAMSAIGSTIAFSLASVGRNTAAALGVLFGYIVVIENVVGNFLAGWRRWLILGNAIVFVTGKAGEATGVRGRSVAGAGLYLAAVAVGFFVAAAAVFQRRDVA